MQRLVSLVLAFSVLALIGRSITLAVPNTNLASLNTVISRPSTESPSDPVREDQATDADEPQSNGRVLGVQHSFQDNAMLFGIAADEKTPTEPDASVVATQERAQDSKTQEPLTDEELVASTVLVVAVIDGDTVELEGGERVRYIGIDTPESTTQHECYGEEAKARNRELVEGKAVRLLADTEDRDKYGRLLRYVYVGDQFVNRRLAEDGFATQLTIPPNVAHADDFRQAVDDARLGKRGLWGGCPADEQNESSRMRTNYDETVPQANTFECPHDKPIKGNAQSMIYHVPGGEFYAKTKPENCFATPTDAEVSGYRKSKR